MKQNSIAIQDYTPVEPSYLDKKTISAFAEKLSIKIRGDEGFENFDLHKIVSFMGGKIKTLLSSKIQDMDGSIYIDDLNKFTIYLPSHTSTVRNNFTIAHEIGHYLLHAHLPEKTHVFATRNGSELVEWEANWFAANFLMPSQIIKEKGLTSIQSVAEYFNVSTSAANIRLKNLMVK